MAATGLPTSPVSGTWFRGSQGNVRQDDGDGDGTCIRWRAANPHFKVQPDQDLMWGHDWVYGGSQVEIGITRGSVTTTFFADLDAGGNFNTGDLGYDIQSSDSVTVTDGASIKTHIVTELQVTTIDTTFDTIGGTAAPGTEVWIDVFGTNRARRVTANGSGYWLASFGTPAGEEDWQQAWDLKLGRQWPRRAERRRWGRHVGQLASQGSRLPGERRRRQPVG